MSDARPDAVRPLRIGYVNWSLGLGGAEQVIIRLALGCKRRGHDVAVFTLNDVGPFAKPLLDAGIPVISMAKRSRYDTSVASRLAAEFRQRKLDVVHTHLWGGNFWGRIAARMAGVPVVVVTEHNVDVWKRPHFFVLDRLLQPLATALVAELGTRGARGLGYERLDQLTMELLLGVR